MSTEMPYINPKYSYQPLTVKPLEYYLKGIKEGNKYVLSESITLLESTKNDKKNLSELIIRNLFQNGNKSFRLGITGTPGVGKSTFIEVFGHHLVDQGHKVAVLTIDPSSQKSKGSILGDKTRMEFLSQNPHVFIRPSPSGSNLGGVGFFTREAILLCEAAGFDFILVETVGVGQSETEVAHITDMCLLMLQPGAGDEIQGIKRGIMETADVIVIHKSDREYIDSAQKTRNQISNAVHYIRHDIPKWTIPVINASSMVKSGIDDIYNHIISFREIMDTHGYLSIKRQKQESLWFNKILNAQILDIILQHERLKLIFNQLNIEINEGKIDTRNAIATFMNEYSKHISL